MVELSYPPELAALYPRDTVEYRKKLNDIMLGYLERGSFKTADADNLIIPYDEVLGALNSPFDIIGSSVLLNNECALFVEDHADGSANREGYGKTAIILELLGAGIDYREIPKTREGLITKGAIMPGHKNKKIKVVSSDISYIGEKNRQLALGAVIGEDLVARWDMARHIWRTARGTEYVSGEQRTPEIREYLIELGMQLRLDADAFADNTIAYAVSIVFAIKREPGAKEVLVEKLLPEERLPKIKNLLDTNPLYHSSPFWKTDKGEHEKRVERIMSSLNPEYIPEIYQLSMPVKNTGIEIKEAAKTVSELLQ